MQISVVIASIVGAPFLDACLASLERQAKALEAEVLVVSCGPKQRAEQTAKEFPWTRVIHVPTRETVPELRRRGVLESRGEIVFVIEEHTAACPDWLEEALRGHQGGAYAAVGGPVAPAGYERIRDWVVYFCEYSEFMPPVTDGETQVLNGANIAYQRRVLVEHQGSLGDGYWEASLHPALMSAGERFRSFPGMVVQHRGPFDFGYYLRQRYWFSRAFAGARIATVTAGHRLAYIVTAPCIPALLLGRIGLRVWRKRCHPGRFLEAVPLIGVALIAYVAGELAGYLAGPGDALSKVE